MTKEQLLADIEALDAAIAKQDPLLTPTYEAKKQAKLKELGVEAPIETENSTETDEEKFKRLKDIGFKTLKGQNRIDYKALKAKLGKK